MCIVIIIKSYFYINKNYYYKNNKIIYIYTFIFSISKRQGMHETTLPLGAEEVRHCKPWTPETIIIDLFGSIRSNEIFLDMIIIPGTIHVHIEIAREGILDLNFIFVF